MSKILNKVLNYLFPAKVIKKTPEQLAQEQIVEEAINKQKAKQKVAIDEHTKFLNMLLTTLVSRKYSSHLEMKTAYDVLNKKWKLRCRDVNSTSKDVNLNKNGFENCTRDFFTKIAKAPK